MGWDFWNTTVFLWIQEQASAIVFYVKILIGKNAATYELTHTGWIHWQCACWGFYVWPASKAWVYVISSCLLFFFGNGVQYLLNCHGIPNHHTYNAKMQLAGDLSKLKQWIQHSHRTSSSLLASLGFCLTSSESWKVSLSTPRSSAILSIWSNTMLSIMCKSISKWTAMDTIFVNCIKACTGPTCSAIFALVMLCYWVSSDKLEVESCTILDFLFWRFATCVGFIRDWSLTNNLTDVWPVSWSCWVYKIAGYQIFAWFCKKWDTTTSTQA